MKKQEEIRSIIHGQKMKSVDIYDMLIKYKPQIAAAIPKHLSPERLIQIATTVIAKNNNLKNCSPSSIIGAVVQASILGFKPIEALGECYFVPFKDKCQFIVGYRGYRKLAFQSNQIKTLYAEVVYEGDEFQYTLGLNPNIIHIPKMNNDTNWTKITHAYAVAHYTNGGYTFVVLDKNKIENLRRRNPSQGVKPSGAWETDYDAMAKAKAVKQLAKWLPLNEELEIAITQDEKVIDVDSVNNPNDFYFGAAGEYLVVEETPNAQATVNTPDNSQTNNDITIIADTSQIEENSMFNNL